MDDKQYIAKLERLLEERKDLINELITICEDLVKEKDKLVGYAECCHKDNVYTHELLERQSKEFDALRNSYEQSCERFDDLFDDYHILDQEHSSTLKDKKDLEKNVERLEGMVKRRDKKIKDLNVRLVSLKIEEYPSKLLDEVNRLECENTYLKEEVKHLNAIVDGAS